MSGKAKIAITLGDPAGIGPEIVLKAFRDVTRLPDCNLFVIGDAGFLRSEASKWAPEIEIREVPDIQSNYFPGHCLNVFDLHNVDSLIPGKASAEGGKAAVAYIRKAVDLICSQAVDAMVTAPINKEALHLAGYSYPGHTEMLADFTNTPEVALMMAGKRLRVVLATTHLSLKDVGIVLTSERLESILRITHKWLSNHVCEQPKIAVTGLNPHASDGGVFGNEEETVIIPVLEKLRNEGCVIDGPFSADALFGRIHSMDYHAVVTMYHDQGMIPIKMDSLGHAVNVTLGLPIIRTSVDHGTAFDIVGKGEASPDSLINAMHSAVDLVRSSLICR